MPSFLKRIKQNLAKYHIVSNTPFKDGVATVELQEETGNRSIYGAIDTDGTILWSDWDGSGGIFDSAEYLRKLYNGYDETERFLLCEAYSDYLNPETNTVEVFSVVTDGVITSIAKMNYDGSVFTNFGEYFINGFDGAIVGNHNYTGFAYWDFKAGHITELCKDYPGKNRLRYMVYQRRADCLHHGRK